MNFEQISGIISTLFNLMVKDFQFLTLAYCPHVRSHLPWTPVALHSGSTHLGRVFFFLNPYPRLSPNQLYQNLRGWDPSVHIFLKACWVIPLYSQAGDRCFSSSPHMQLPVFLPWIYIFKWEKAL